MILPLVVLIASLGAASAAPQNTLLKPVEPQRQFDFWVGEWSVQNRSLVDDGSDKNFRWKEGDVTRARITPVCNGAGLLEEWAGPFHGAFMNGFSLRSYHPDDRRWSILLFWTTDGNGAFGRMHGDFRHGRGEFLSNTQGPKRTRYTFSDALPNSVRWDQALTVDYGKTWKTDWIMEFSRTRASQEMTRERFFETEWTEGTITTHSEARQLDWMIGSWVGFYTSIGGSEKDARMQCKTISKGCLLVENLETQIAQGMAWESQWTVRGYESGKKAWGAWSLSEQDPVLRGSTWMAAPAPGKELRPGLASFSRLEAGTEFVRTLQRSGPNLLTMEWYERNGDRSDSVLVATARFQRKKAE